MLPLYDRFFVLFCPAAGGCRRPSGIVLGVVIVVVPTSIRNIPYALFTIYPIHVQAKQLARIFDVHLSTTQAAVLQHSQRSQED